MKFLSELLNLNTQAPIASSTDSMDINNGGIEPPDPPSREELLVLVRSFSYWYHRIYLGRGVYTRDTQAYHKEVMSTRQHRQAGN